MAEKIRYEVDVDSSDAKRGLQDFSRAAKKAGKDAASAFDDTASAGDKARAAIKQMAETMDTELRSSAKAADALATALGPELTGRIDVASVVTDLNKMGVSFQEITDDADKFATTLREVDGVRVQQVSDGIDTTRKRTDELTASSEKSRNAMANMWGNAAQDLGALGGIAGSAGVALGQLAEGAADAANEGESLGSVFRGVAGSAGPIVGLGVAVGVATKLWSNYQAAQAEVARQTSDVAKSLIELSGIVDQVNEGIAKQAETGDFGDKLLSSLTLTDEKIVNILASATQLGIAFTDVGDIIAGMGAKGDLQGFDLLISHIEKSLGLTRVQAEGVADAVSASGNNWDLLRQAVINNTDLTAAQVDQLKEQLLLYGSIGQAAKDTDINKAAKQYLETLKLTDQGLQQIADATQRLHDQGILNPSEIQVASEIARGYTDVARSLDDLNRSTAESRQITAATEQNWRILLADLADGRIDTQNAADAWNILQTALGLTNDEMQKLVDQKVSEELQAQTTAADELTQNLTDAQAALDGLATIDTSQIASGLQDALDAVDDGIGHLKFAEDLQHQFDDALKDAHKFGPDLRELLDLQAAGVTITPDITLGNLESDDAEFLAWVQSLQQMVKGGAVEAFTTGGTDAANAFVQAQAAAFLAANPQLTLADFYNLMGLPPDGNIGVIVSPVIATEKLNAIQPIIDQLVSSGVLSPEIALRISALNIDDPEAALALAVQTLEGLGLEVPVQLQPDTEGFQQQMDGVTATPWGTTVDITSNADDIGDDIGTATEDRRTQVIVPKSPSLGQMQTLIDFVARDRIFQLIAKADNAGLIDRTLDAVAVDRVAEFFSIVNEGSRRNADATLDNVARDRVAHVTVQTSGSTASGGGGTVPGGTSAAPSSLSAPTAAVRAPSAVTMSTPATVVNNNNISIRAGVLGNHFDVERSVTRALRRSARINGARAVTP